MYEEKKLSLKMMRTGYLLFVIMILVDNQQSSFISCSNHNIALCVNTIFRFTFNNKEFIVSLLNPISITLFLSGCIALQNVRIKSKANRNELLQCLIWCKYYLVCLYTPEEMAQKIKVDGFFRGDSIKAIILKRKLNQLENSLQSAYLQMGSKQIIEFEQNADSKEFIQNKLWDIKKWAEEREEQCDLTISGEHGVRVAMISPKPFINIIDEVVLVFIYAYCPNKSHQQIIENYMGLWNERVDRIKSSVVDKVI